ANGGGFNWSLTEEGNNCDFARVVTSGNHTLPVTSSDYYWYKYTMASTAKLVVSSATSNDVALYANTCDNLHWGGSGAGSVTGIDFESGDDVFMRWYANGGGFAWSLTEVDFEEGDKCDYAEVVASGNHTLPVTSLNYYWCSYTMPGSGLLEVISATSNDVELYYNTCDNLYSEGSGAGSVTGTDFESGDVVFIRWEANGGDFGWELTFTETVLGTLSVANLEIYPNPTSDFITIKGLSSSYAKVTINSLDGRLIKLVEGEVSRIDVSALDTGIYLINLEVSNGKYHSGKIVIE
ncbi:MAG: T9SS type A sorting domain-containing protein, partial [Cytophagales bacterium]|nr:T9SS type A sorting domain-containing protein [Cytophagales bacterium]